MPSSVFTDRYALVVAVLTEARKSAGVTQVELATRLKRPQSYISKVENRERRIDPVEFHDWAAALGRDASELFNELTLQLGAR